MKMFKRLACCAAVAALATGCIAGNPHASSTKIYIQQKDNAKALAEAQSWAESDPTSAKPYLWMGLIKASEEDYVGAADMFTRAFTMDSSTRNMQALDKELTISGTAVFDGVRVYQVLINAAITRMNEGKLPEALPYLDQAVALNPNDGQAYLFLVNIYEQTEQMEKAREALALANEKNPNNPQIKLHLALFAEQDGKLDEAETLIKEALAVDSAYAEAYKELGFVNYERAKKIEEKFEAATDIKVKEELKKDIQKQYGVAATNFEKAAALDPELGEAWLNLGICYIKMEALDKSVSALEKYTTINGNDYNGFFLLAGALASTEDKANAEKALVAINTAISIKPTAEAYNLKGAILKLLNRKKEAMEAFKMAIELEGKNK